MEKSKLVPGQKYLHHREIIIDGRKMEAERRIRCLKITNTGALFCYEYEVLELKDREIQEEILS